MGMSASTGRRLDGLDHIRQSVADIITTPVGSRVMRREYGSLVPELLDMPITDALMMRVYAATVIAVSRWEPRINITGARQQVSSQTPGAAVIELTGETVTGEPLSVEVPIL